VRHDCIVIPTGPLHFAASTRRLGRFASSAPLQLVSTALSAIVLGTNLALIWSIVDKLEPTPVVLGSAVVGGTLDFGVCARLVWEDLTGTARRLRRRLGVCWRRVRRASREVDAELIEEESAIEGELLSRYLSPSLSPSLSAG
jgi:hypothetical protein